MKLTLRSLFAVGLTAAGAAFAASDSTEYTFPGDYLVNAKNNVYGMNYFSMRPVHHNAHRRLAGCAGTSKLHVFGQEEFYGVASLALEFQQTRKEANFAQWFSFASDGNSDMTYGATSGSYDIYGLNFGVTASGTITMKPRIQNLTADFDIFLGWDEFVCGLWTRIGVPINYTRWDLRLTDTLDAGTALTSYPHDLMDDTAIGTLVSVAYSDLKSAWKGDKAFGDSAVRTKGLISGRQNKTAVSGLKFELGYDFLRREHGHAALAAVVVTPTGNTPSGQYLFEPISGSSDSWEVGGNFSGHWNFWENSDCDQSLGIHVDATVTTLLKRQQTRIFGLKAGTAGTYSPGASFLMLKKFNSDGTYAGVLTYGSEVLALSSKIGASFLANVGALLMYTRNHFNIQAGYEFFHRSREKISNRTAVAASTYGIKGAELAANVNTASTSTISTNGAQQTTSSFISDSLVVEQAALHPRYQSHKAFGFIEYAWDNCDWEPSIGAGASYEWGASVSSAKNVAADQWGVMLKGSISF